MYEIEELVWNSW